MYDDKIENYEANNKCAIGRLQNFDEYILQFVQNIEGDGIDVGTGPKGYYGRHFKKATNIDGCDSEESVVNSLPPDYNKKFIYFLGGDEPLPFADESKDFALCSCVIQHLSGEEALIKGIK